MEAFTTALEHVTGLDHLSTLVIVWGVILFVLVFLITDGKGVLVFVYIVAGLAIGYIASTRIIFYNWCSAQAKAHTGCISPDKFLLFVACIIVPLVAWLCYRLVLFLLLEKLGQETMGVIIRKRTTNPARPLGPSVFVGWMLNPWYEHCVEYRFNLNGKDYFGKSQITENNYYECNEGDPISVTYWQYIPALNLLTNVHFNRTWFTSTANMIFMLAVTLLCYGYYLKERDSLIDTAGRSAIESLVKYQKKIENAQ